MDWEWINDGAKCREKSRVFGWHGRVDPPERVPRQRILMDKPPLFTLARNNCIVFLTMTERACVPTAGVDGLRLAMEYRGFPATRRRETISQPPLRTMLTVKNFDDSMQMREHGS